MRAAAVAVLAAAGLTGGALPAAHAAPASDAGITDQFPSAAAVSADTEGLDPLLATAFDRAAAEAAAQGVTLSITSGYRSPGQQQALWEDGIRTYGSPDAARRWVLPPEESTHVSGQAIDVGPREGAQWLEENGNRWGLCRTYDNEWWHFELATVPGAACPARLPDASTR
ncbi:M15 family metallopeptidase [Nocardia inohanensis]|uniref:M15 family metallopeptidase n=1 Tax=Nocardia inohanensis TaxID=209246 RepID=UPI00082DB37D|nr:M15 family metallopeptidase [Nocardia inohanensis]